MRQLTLTRPGLLALLTLSTSVFRACDPSSLSVFSCVVCRKLENFFLVLCPYQLNPSVGICSTFIAFQTPRVAWFHFLKQFVLSVNQQ